MTSKRTRVTPLLVFFAALTLTGCDSAPEPTPTPTSAFATEEEAFAAAEEVYREYSNAGNAGEDTTDFLTGSALETELETNRYLSENGLTFSGASVMESFTGTSFSAEEVGAVVCLDISSVAVLDASGNDVTPPDRVDRMNLEVTFISTKNGLFISESNVAPEPSC